MEEQDRDPLHGEPTVLTEMLTRAEQVIHSGQERVVRTNQRVQESLFTLRFAKEIRAASVFPATGKRLSLAPRT